MKNKVFYCLIVLTLLIITSCEDHDDNLGLRGQLIGSIETFDEFGEPLADNSAYEVIVEGTDPVMKTMTDASGEFVIHDLPTGTYNFIFQKDKFQIRKIFSYRFVGGNVPTYFDPVYLSQLPTTTITSFGAYVSDENNPDPDKYTVIHIEYEIGQNSSYSQPRYVAVFLGSSPNTSCNTYDQQINLNTGNYSYKIDKLSSGAKLYAVAYSVPVLCNGYFDPTLKGYINSCVNNQTDPVEILVP